MKYFSQIFAPTNNRRLNELVGFLLCISALLLFLALASYSPLDPSLNSASVLTGSRAARNWIGVVGALISDLVLQGFGIGAFLLPDFLCDAGRPLVSFAQDRFAGRQGSGRNLAADLCPGSAGASAGPLALDECDPDRRPVWQDGRGFSHPLLQPGGSLHRLRQRPGRGAVSLDCVFFRRSAGLGAHPLCFRDCLVGSLERLAGCAGQEAHAERTGKTPRRAQASHHDADGSGAACAAPLQPQLRTPSRSDRHRSNICEESGAESSVNAESKPSRKPISPEVTERADSAQKPKTTLPRIAGGFKLPPSSLLHRPDEQQAIDADELKLLAQVLTEKYAEFDVHGQITQINPGPVVTTFEFKPEAGIKYSRITNLTDDLCLALKAESILIERMAGKSTVGIQVPNREREIIWLRENIESTEFIGSKSKLTLALGKDINGRIVTADLNGMPHLLIAGSTGAGKSVAINAMIMSILYKATPDQVRLILVDPKRLELGNYEGVPHLYTPIITEPKLAANALRNAVREMERRLKLLAEKGVRNIDQYNKLFDENGTPSLFGDDAEERPLPYIVIIIDELADLMMLDSSNVEESITRLAQMARAVGIHLVLATQRPSVDVITG